MGMVIHSHHANDQINIRTLLEIRRAWMLSICDALKYVHATFFLNIHSRYPRYEKVYNIFYHLNFATQQVFMTLE